MDTAKLLHELVRDEDLRLRPYRCPAGKLTIGVGRNLDDRGITRDEALVLARNDIAVVERELDRALPWWRDLDGARQRVLANMAFNMGTPKLLEFRATLAAARAGHFLEASQQMLDSKWARQVGARAVRLAALMRDGEGGAVG